MIRTLILLVWLVVLHPVHVSLLSIDYEPEQERFNMFLRIYFDDFLLDSGIRSEDQKNLDFTGVNSLTREVIDKYVSEKIGIFINDSLSHLEIVDMNLADNELRMNLFFDSGRNVNTITVKNSIMTSLYEDQANMIIVRMNGFEEGVKLTPEMTEKTFRIN
jgi:hypothetical protein